MKNPRAPLDLKRIKVLPLLRRKSLSSLEKILVDPDQPPPHCPADTLAIVRDCAQRIQAAKEKNAAVVLMYGAHLVKNGLQRVVNRLVKRGFVTHLATNGAGIIHDWEFSYLGKSEESVRENVPTGRFGTWDETGRNIHLAILAGALHGQGFGQSLGQFIEQDGVTLPSVQSLESEIRSSPSHPLTPARAELLRAMVAHKLPEGRIEVKHPHKLTSVVATAARHNTSFTVHPGIGYDIIATHPMFRGAAIGRAADIDFRLLGSSIDHLDGGVVMSVGSAIMAPQVFEKSLSCVNNLRLQDAKAAVEGHWIYVVDLQDGGNWDWAGGEPPKTNPAYYLRFCKSFSRMGGIMKYAQSDNGIFLHNLLHVLTTSTPAKPAA
jgi:hypothetical protein